MIDRRSTLTRGALIGATTAAALGSQVPVFAQSSKEKVSVAVGSEHAMVYLPWDLAKALGYFDAEGLDVSLTYTKGGSEASQALVSGSVDYSGNAVDHAIAAQGQGKSIVMIVDFMGAPGISMLVRNADKEKYRAFKDLKGKTLGVTSVGSATHVLGVWLARQSGFDRKDMQFIGVGGGPTVVAALDRGAVDAAFANDPFATELIRTGKATQMLDMFDPRVVKRETGFPIYAFTGATTRADVIKNKPAQVQKIVNALVRAQKFMAVRTSLEIAKALPDEFRTGIAVDVWAAAYSHSRPAYTNHGEISPEGVHNVVVANSFFLGDAAPKNLVESALIDNSFVQRAYKTVKV